MGVGAGAHTKGIRESDEERDEEADKKSENKVQKIFQPSPPQIFSSKKASVFLTVTQSRFTLAVNDTVQGPVLIGVHQMALHLEIRSVMCIGAEEN